MFVELQRSTVGVDEEHHRPAGLRVGPNRFALNAFRDPLGANGFDDLHLEGEVAQPRWPPGTWAEPVCRES